MANKLKLFSSMKDLLHAIGQKGGVLEGMRKDGTLTISADVMGAIQTLFFGKDAMEEAKARRALFVLGLDETAPFMGWQMEKSTPQDVLALFGQVILFLSVSHNYDLMGPFAEQLAAMSKEFKESPEKFGVEQ